VLKKAPSYHSLALGTGDTVAIRVPDHPVPRELVQRLGAPITGTSANRSEAASPLTAVEVREQLGERVDLIIDGGRCPGGVESSVVDCTVDPPRLLREGAISWEDIERALAEGHG
jgi:L-threonylcarbamoyladenylate synthase